MSVRHAYLEASNGRSVAGFMIAISDRIEESSGEEES